MIKHIKKDCIIHIIKKINNTEQMAKWLLKSDNRALITFVNPSSITKANIDCITHFSHIYVDSMALKYALNVLFGMKCEQLSADFSSMLGEFFDYCVSNDLSITIVGGTKDEVRIAASKISERWPNLKVKATSSGFFESLDARDQFIRSIDSDVVLVGMGAPLQEEFLVDCKRFSNIRIGITCGGFITQTATRTVFYRWWAIKFNLRWLQRAWEQKHTRRRLMVEYPLFFLFLFRLILISRVKI